MIVILRDRHQDLQVIHHIQFQMVRVIFHPQIRVVTFLKVIQKIKYNKYNRKLLVVLVQKVALSLQIMEVALLQM